MWRKYLKHVYKKPHARPYLASFVCREWSQRHPADGAAGIDFYKAAFDAKELGERYRMPDGTLVHAELLIGDSVVMVKDAQEDEFNALLCTYWPDVDAAWDRAVRAGAAVIYPLADHFYGERGGRLGDPFGNQWMLAARIETLTPAELAAREPDAS